jgi:hypothetical protein
MITTLLTFLGSALVACVGFLFGRIYSETEKILAEKRTLYTEFLASLPNLHIAYQNMTDDDFKGALEAAHNKIPKLLFYADPQVMIAYDNFHKCFWKAHAALGPNSPELALEYKALARAQNDLVLEMRRDAFRWSLFNYSGKRRITEA